MEEPTPITMESSKTPDTSPAYQLSKIGGKIVVKAPYNEKFVKQAHAMGGKWNGVDRSWQFPLSKERKVAKACEAVYGGHEQSVVKQATAGIGKAVGKAVKRALESNPKTKPIAMAYKGATFSAKVLGFGMNGMRGVSHAATVMGGAPRKLRGAGVSTNYSLGMEERERGLQHGLTR